MTKIDEETDDGKGNKTMDYSLLKVAPVRKSVKF
jgi:hypothetical protein